MRYIIENLITIAQGNFNQGHYRFGSASGKQCVAGSYTLYNKDEWK